MPLPMVHLAVASLALKECSVTDLPAYYLGNIAPDGVHMLENCTPADKDRSHLGTRSSHDPAAVGEFLKRIPELANKDYGIGYALHILTDVCWIKNFMPVFDKRYRSDPHPLQARRPAYYGDTDQLDLELYRTLPQREEIWKQLTLAKAEELPGLLSARGADLWNARTLRWFGEQAENPVPARYVTLEELLDFVQEAAGFGAEYLASRLD